MFLFFNGFDSLCSRPSIAVVCLMIPSVTIVLDYHVPWTYEVLYCKKTFQIDASFKEGKFRILTNSFITPFLIILTMLSHVSICMYIYIYIYTLYMCVCIFCIQPLYYGYLPSFGYVRTSSLEVCELFYKHKQMRVSSIQRSRGSRLQLLATVKERCLRMMMILSQRSRFQSHDYVYSLTSYFHYWHTMKFDKFVDEIGRE